MHSSARAFSSTLAAVFPTDLLPNRRFEDVRPRLQPIMAEMRRRRRHRLGPHCTIAFENRDTVLWQIHEVLRVEGRQRPDQIVDELHRYDPLVPRFGELRATVFVDGGPPEVAAELCACLATGAAALQLRVGEATCHAECVEEKPEPRDPVRYVRFPMADVGLRPLHLANLPATLFLRVYRAVETSLPRELMHALATDLQVAGEHVPSALTSRACATCRGDSP